MLGQRKSALVRENVDFPGPRSELRTVSFGAIPLGHRPGSPGASHEHLQGGPQIDHHNRPFGAKEVSCWRRIRYRLRTLGM